MCLFLNRNRVNTKCNKMIKCILLLPLIFFLSCSQDPVVNPSAQNLIGEKWIMDSTWETVNGTVTTDILNPPDFLHIQYFANGTYVLTSNNFVAPITKSFLHRNDTIYYWTPPGSMSPDKYSVIKSVGNKRLRTQQVQAGGQITDEFFHQP